MNENDMDSAFDTVSVIKSLTVNNLGTTSFKDMLAILSPLVLTEVPEGEDANSKRRLDFLLARTANLYAYIQVLWCEATNQRARSKAGGLASADEWAKKKEALYALGQAVKQKYEAASRRITVALEDEDSPSERASYDARRDRKDARQWGKETGEQRPATGGWGNVS